MRAGVLDSRGADRANYRSWGYQLAKTRYWVRRKMQIPKNPSLRINHIDKPAGAPEPLACPGPGAINNPPHDAS
jgi:hypothetical protein